MMDLDEGGREELSWQHAGQLDAEIVPRQGRSRGIQGFEKFLIRESTESSSLRNSLGNTIGVPKTASDRERPVSSLGCARSPRSTKGNS
jgi:hypothetical protein